MRTVLAVLVVVPILFSADALADGKRQLIYTDNTPGARNSARAALQHDAIYSWSPARVVVTMSDFHRALDAEPWARIVVCVQDAGPSPALLPELMAHVRSNPKQTVWMFVWKAPDGLTIDEETFIGASMVIHLLRDGVTYAVGAGNYWVGEGGERVKQWNGFVWPNFGEMRGSVTTTDQVRRPRRQPAESQPVDPAACDECDGPLDAAWSIALRNCDSTIEHCEAWRKITPPSEGDYAECRTDAIKEMLISISDANRRWGNCRIERRCLVGDGLKAQ